jgi:hypothetical protein
VTAPPAEPAVASAAVVAGTTAAGEALAAHRVDLEFLLGLALAEVAEFWRTATGTPDVIRDALADALRGWAATYTPAAATLGADWYDDMRDVTAAPGRFRAIPADPPGQDRLDALVGWGTQPLFVGPAETDEDGNVVRAPRWGDPDFVPDIPTTTTLVTGAVQRLVADADRASVIGSLRADPAGRGWARQATGASCPFCVMLAGRGAVYSADTANFSSHDNCDCIAVPVFGGDPRPVKPYVPSQKMRSQAQRFANNTRVREYLRTQRT